MLNTTSNVLNVLRTEYSAFADLTIPSRKTGPPHSLSAYNSHNLQVRKINFIMIAGSSIASTRNKYYTVGITGSGGLIGTALRDELSRREIVSGKPVRIVRLSRGNVVEPKGLEDKPGEISLQWNPAATTPDGVISQSALAEMDAIVHLSGEKVMTKWTEENKAEILNSRVNTTSALANALAASSLEHPVTFLTASGMGVYGIKFLGNAVEAVDEYSDVSSNEGFAAEVARKWEAASSPAKRNKNIRVVNLRCGAIISTKGGMLANSLIYKLGIGGKIGSGDQYLSFASARDNARAIVHILETPALEGPVNICAPNPCTNAEFTSALGKILGRPTFLPMPSFVVSALFGEAGKEMMLGGVRMMPTKLTRSGFQFKHPTIVEALHSALNESI